MASTSLVYATLKRLANKEQKGFITPEVFNVFASTAQMNVYNELFSDLVDAKRLSRQGFEMGRDKSVRKQKLEDLAFFVKRQVISLTDTAEERGLYAAAAPGVNGFLKPSDLGKIISIRAYDTDYKTAQFTVNQGTKMNPCELLYDIEKANYILGSNLSTPTHEYPVAIISKTIEIFPSTVQEIELTYYKLPENAFYAEIPNSVSPDGGIPDGLKIKNFTMPDHYVPELVAELAKLIGIRLRDPDTYAYGTKEEAAN
tara:strand:- start:5049 stop:5819 length:771 start_codon:yes stop_codon:yes gene_type:complete